jgi:dTDP-4-dehydrorhamnose reductase
MRQSRPILVAGRSGQVARCLVEVASDRGLRLVALGRPDLDIENSDLIGRTVAAIAPGMIINAAAYTAVDKAEREPARAFAINRDGAGRLAAAAAAARIPYIHLSTDYVYDGLKPSAYVEGDPPSPQNVYGRSKLEGEAVVRDVCPFALVLRTSWIYSPYGQNFVKTMVRLAQNRELVRIVDDQRGAPTAARDFASAILDMARQLPGAPREARAGIYHLTARGDTTWHGFADAIFAGWKERGRRVPRLERIATAEFPVAAPRPLNSRLDCTKIEKAFGVRLPHWSESLGPCLDALAADRAETS